MITITNDFLMDTRKVWQAGDSKVVTMSHDILKTLGCQKGDMVQLFVRKVIIPEGKPKVEIKPTTMQPTPEEIQYEPKDQESKPEVPNMPLRTVS